MLQLFYTVIVVIDFIYTVDDFVVFWDFLPMSYPECTVTSKVKLVSFKVVEIDQSC